MGKTALKLIDFGLAKPGASLAMPRSLAHFMAGGSLGLGLGKSGRPDVGSRSIERGFHQFESSLASSFLGGHPAFWGQLFAGFGVCFEGMEVIAASNETGTARWPTAMPSE